MSTDSKQNEPGQSSGIFLDMLTKVGIQIKDGVLVYNFKDTKALDQAIRLLKKGLEIRSIPEAERLEGATYLDVLEAYRAVRQSSPPEADADLARSIEQTNKFYTLAPPPPPGTNLPDEGATTTGESPMAQNSEPKPSLVSDPPESTGMDPFQAARDVEAQLAADRAGQPRHVAAAAIVEDPTETSVLQRPPSIHAPPDKIPGEDEDDRRQTRILDPLTDNDADEGDENEEEDEDENEEEEDLDLAHESGGNLRRVSNLRALPLPRALPSVVAPPSPPATPPPALKPLPDPVRVIEALASPKRPSTPPPPDPEDAAKTNVLPPKPQAPVASVAPASLLGERKPLPPPSIQPPRPLPPPVSPPLPSYSRVESDSAAARPAPSSSLRSVDVAMSETAAAPSLSAGPAPVGSKAVTKPPTAPLPAVVISSAMDPEQLARAQQVVTPKPVVPAPAKASGASGTKVPWRILLAIALGVAFITLVGVLPGILGNRAAVNLPKKTVGKSEVCEQVTAENLKQYLGQNDPHAFIDMASVKLGEPRIDATKGKTTVVGRKMVFDVSGAKVCTGSTCVPVTPLALQHLLGQSDPENFVDADAVRPGKPYISTPVALKPKGERLVYDLLVEPGVVICHF